MLNFILIMVFCANGSDPAEKAYNTGQYGSAFTLYQQRLSQTDDCQGALLFNMGNCAFRLERYVEAVYYYKRALLRAPNDPAVQFNLNAAQQQLGLNGLKAKPFGEAFLSFLNLPSPHGLLGLIALLQSISLMGLLLYPRGRLKPIFMTLLLLLCLVCAAHLVQKQWFKDPPEAVAMKNEIPLRLEPHEDFTVSFTIGAGQIVTVAERSNRWARVIHANGQGWVPCSDLGMVD